LEKKKPYLLIAILLFVTVLVTVPGCPAVAEPDICKATHFTSAPVRILSIGELCGRYVQKSATVFFTLPYIYIYIYSLGSATYILSALLSHTIHCVMYMPLRLTPISSALLTHKLFCSFHGTGVLLKKLMGPELFKKFLEFYATLIFIAACTSVRQLSTPRAGSIQYISSPVHIFVVYNYLLRIYL
jgi:uncharacterized protein YceK